jgi:hypothetical protein
LPGIGHCSTNALVPLLITGTSGTSRG